MRESRFIFAWRKRKSECAKEVFEVIKHLPGTSEPEYRIKSANEPHERVALESELTRA